MVGVSKVPTQGEEAGYMGFTTFITSLILLTPGQSLSESRLEKHLRRVNSDEFALSQPTDTILKRLIKEGYLVKAKERDQTGGEETVEYSVGPRGRVEVGEKGVAGVVRGVFGKKDEEGEELERRLVRSLGEGVKMVERRRGREGEGDAEGRGGDGDGNGNGNGGGGGEQRQGGREEETQVMRRTTRASGSGRGQVTYAGTARGGRAAAGGRGGGGKGTRRREESEEEEDDDDDEDEEDEE